MNAVCRNLLIAGAITIWTIKFGIRPYFHFGALPKFLLGIAPNLLGSFLIPFAAVCFFEGRKNVVALLFNIRSVSELRFVCFLGFFLLLINEYLQLIPVFRRTFDYYDIFASAIGLSCSYFVFGNLCRYSLREMLYIGSFKIYLPSLRLK